MTDNCYSPYSTIYVISEGHTSLGFSVKALQQVKVTVLLNLLYWMHPSKLNFVLNSKKDIMKKEGWKNEKGRETFFFFATASISQNSPAQSCAVDSIKWLIFFFLITLLSIVSVSSLWLKIQKWVKSSQLLNLITGVNECSGQLKINIACSISMQLLAMCSFEY